MAQKKIILYGGKGALGSSCIKILKSHGCWINSIDFNANDKADFNTIVKPTDSWMEQSEDVLKQVAVSLGDDKVDGIVCVAGGWAGGNAANASFIKNADLMWKQSVWTSSIAAAIGAKHLKEGGVLILTGAQPALNKTPGMLGYGMAKAAVHQLTKSLSAKSGGLPKDSYVAAILPMTLDTEVNRLNMPKGDHSKWTPLDTVAKYIESWINGQERPANGSLIKLITLNNETTLEIE